MMKFNGIYECLYHFVCGEDEDGYHEWMRHNADSWDVRMGESWETVYDCEKLEGLFQFHMEIRRKQDKMTEESNDE